VLKDEIEKFSDDLEEKYGVGLKYIEKEHRVVLFLSKKLKGKTNFNRLFETLEKSIPIIDASLGEHLVKKKADVYIKVEREDENFYSIDITTSPFIVSEGMTFQDNPEIKRRLQILIGIKQAADSIEWGSER
jgi:hypothetical protein